jgi:hypothetical protein
MQFKIYFSGLWTWIQAKFFLYKWSEREENKIKFAFYAWHYYLLKLFAFDHRIFLIIFKRKKNRR